MDRDKTYLLDILISAGLVLDYTAGISKDTFLSVQEIQDAVIRRLEIIGEATRRISGQFKKKYPDLPWKEILGLRNFIIHEYDDINLKVIWDTVKNDLPPLIEKVKCVLKEAD